MMRRFFLLSSVLGVFFTFQSGIAQAGDQDFALLNRTGYQIDEVYVSRSSSRNWGGDIMGSDALENGRSVNITFNAPDNVCRWDMKVKYNDGDEATWNSLNLCNISKVTLFWDKKKEVTRAVTE
jgi:hypothetical protein